MTFRDRLNELNACDEAIEWVGDKTLQEAWNTCERGDWMLWLYVRLYPDRKRERVLAAAHCANLVRHLMIDERSRNAVDVAIAYGEGRATNAELRKAADAAYAADAADAADAAYAAAARAADAADVATYAADAATYATYAAVADAAYAATLKQCADICRTYLSIDGEE